MTKQVLEGRGDYKQLDPFQSSSELVRNYEVHYPRNNVLFHRDLHNGGHGRPQLR